MYHFTPPTTTYKVGNHPLFRRMSNVRGMAVVEYADGSIREESSAPSIDGTTVVNAWPGGRRFLVTDAQAATLTTAGYGAYLEAVV